MELFMNINIVLGVFFYSFYFFTLLKFFKIELKLILF
jgi:hypothetical protein